MGKEIEVKVKFPVTFRVDPDSFKVFPDQNRKQELIRMAREILEEGETEDPEVKESSEI